MINFISFFIAFILMDFSLIKKLSHLKFKEKKRTKIVLFEIKYFMLMVKVSNFLLFIMCVSELKSINFIFT